MVGSVGQPPHEGHTFFMTFPILDISNPQTYVKRGFPSSSPTSCSLALLYTGAAQGGWRRRGVIESSLAPLEAKLDPRKKVGRI